ncbi:HU family DNA-binding protein [Treponema sp.]|uniref:HU family DNA-binding protein n=1 Tax=Treponema sp. TaxID=166 RepID=UPI003FD7D68E
MVKHQGEATTIKYKILKRANPIDRTQELYYPAPVFGERVTEDELAAEISFASSVNQSDVRSVLFNLLEILPGHLMHGDSVELEKFGIFRMSFESISSKEEKDVSAKNITRPKILFRPSTKLKDKIGKTSFVHE